jgi:hypothetical protein
MTTQSPDWTERANSISTREASARGRSLGDRVLSSRRAKSAAFWSLTAIASIPVALAASRPARFSWPRVGVQRRRLSRGALSALGLAVGFGLFRWQLQRLFTEEPKYEIERRVGKLEIRRYPKMVYAETTVSTASWRTALGEGFYRLARYIFGGNGRGERLSMTAPVAMDSVRHPRDEDTGGEWIEMTAPVTTVATAEGYTVRFVMPEGRAIDQLPPPKDARVELREAPAKRVAVIRFAGPFTASSAEARSRELIALAKDAGYAPTGTATFAGYDPPSTLPFLRRNEAWIEIA